MGRHASEHSRAQPLADPSSPSEPILICQAGARNLAIPVGLVIETMRPQPIDPLPGAPAYVAGVSLIRGEAVPVVDVALLLDAGAGVTAGRFVTITLPDRTVALAVTSVTGVENVPAGTLSALPPLLGGSDANVLAGMGRMDGALLLTLAPARLIPEETWAALDHSVDQPPVPRTATDEQVTSP